MNDKVKAKKEHVCSRHFGYLGTSYTIRKGENYYPDTILHNGRHLTIDKYCSMCHNHGSGYNFPNHTDKDFRFNGSYSQPSEKFFAKPIYKTIKGKRIRIK